MTKIIAILFLLGQFQVAVENSKGYFVRAYPDTDIGIDQFMDEIRTVLAAETGRFYPCVGYEGAAQDLLNSRLAKKIQVVEKLRTGRRDPGIADAPWVVRDDQIKNFLVNHPTEKLDAKVIEKVCLSLLPSNYKQLYPVKSGVKEFYRLP